MSVTTTDSTCFDTNFSNASVIAMAQFTGDVSQLGNYRIGYGLSNITTTLTNLEGVWLNIGPGNYDVFAYISNHGEGDTLCPAKMTTLYGAGIKYCGLILQPVTVSVARVMRARIGSVSSMLTCFSKDTSDVTLRASGGVPPYFATAKQKGAVVASGWPILSLMQGVYIVRVHDSVGCSEAFQLTVTQEQSCTVSSLLPLCHIGWLFGLVRAYMCPCLCASVVTMECYYR